MRTVGRLFCNLFTFCMLDGARNTMWLSTFYADSFVLDVTPGKAMLKGSNCHSQLLYFPLFFGTES
jgi:hypothetical protein